MEPLLPETRTSFDAMATKSGVTLFSLLIRALRGITIEIDILLVEIGSEANGMIMIIDNVFKPAIFVSIQRWTVLIMRRIN